MKTTVQHVSLPKGRRVIAVSDIHGHPDHLRSLLKQIAYTPDDTLILDGDLIERGPDNLGTLRLSMTLQKQGAYVLVGNVDLWQFHWITQNDLQTAAYLFQHVQMQKARGVSTLFSEMCEEAGLPHHSPEDVQNARPVLWKRFQEELDFIDQLPTILDTGSAVFVHGGIPTGDTDSLAGLDPRPFLKNDHFLTQNVAFDRWVVVGHWPATLYCKNAPCFNPYIREDLHIASIDGGMGILDDGQLNALIFDDDTCRHFTCTSFDTLPRIQALDAQEASPESFYLRYGDCQVHVVFREGDCALVEHKRTGYRLWVPESYLYDKNRRCRDCTDYRLPVQPGDILSLIIKTSRGVLAKKNGTVGWYGGNFVLS